ncbi:hypothetical protein [Streptomyces sp. NPDC001091]
MLTEEDARRLVLAEIDDARGRVGFDLQIPNPRNCPPPLGATGMTVADTHAHPWMLGSEQITVPTRQGPCPAERRGK